MKKFLILIVLFLSITLTEETLLSAQELAVTFGKEFQWETVLQERNADSRPINWMQVNTKPETWKKKNDVLVCTGLPIGVVRTEKEYENFIMHIEWRHMEPGGNSGTFVWSKAVPGKNRLPDGVEVQMLDPEWVNLNMRNGEKPPVAYVHGELFGVGGVEIVPDNPRGVRSKSKENRVKETKKWNTYDVICVDGTIKLSVNGKFVNGISHSTQKKGYICLEAEGAEIQFRNIQIYEIP